MTLADRKTTAFSSQFFLITASFLCQYINKTGFRACVKELFVQQHDPLSVSYAVLPGEKALKFGYDVTRQCVCILITDYETIFNEVHPDWVVTGQVGLQCSRGDGRSFLFFFFFRAYSHCKLQNFLVFVRVVSLFGPFFSAGEETKLISIHFCVLKMSVHLDGASTTVPVTLPVRNVSLGPTQV